MKTNKRTSKITPMPITQVNAGSYASVAFERTLRIPEDGKTYPLPPSMGEFPLLKVSDFAQTVPQHWLEAEGENYFLPMYQREAMWLSFSYTSHPTALKVGVGNVCALTGKVWDTNKKKKLALNKTKQNYLVIPTQPWLDGINSGKDSIKQFVAMPLGMGYTVEGQVTGSEDFGGLQLIFFPAKPGRIPQNASNRHRFTEGLVGSDWMDGSGMSSSTLYAGGGKVMAKSFSLSAYNEGSSPFRGISPTPVAGAEMGLGAGGTMKQAIYPDPYGVDTWDTTKPQIVNIFLCNSMLYSQITAMAPPATPVTAASYSQHNYPWFDIYDEHKGDITPSKVLKKVKTLSEMDKEKGFGPQQDDTTVHIPPKDVITYSDWPKPPHKVVKQ